MISKVFSLRGATTIEENSKEEIIKKSVELIDELIEKNNLKEKRFSIVNIMISTTEDITAFYPARAIREHGIEAPLFSAKEPQIDGALPLTIRYMLTVTDSLPYDVSNKHVYLHGAAGLRPDLKD